MTTRSPAAQSRLPAGVALVGDALSLPVADEIGGRVLLDGPWFVAARWAVSPKGSRGGPRRR